MDEMNDQATTSADDAQAPAKEGVGARGAARGIVALILIVVATMFAVQNSESVDVSFLAWDFSMSKILLMILSALVGATLTFLLSAVRRRRS
jgi:uncharacterized integral membrane protein